VQVKERFKILVVGVGGQGALSAARFLGEAALETKLQVNVGQLHGMSQRGGSVEASVIIGPGHSSHIGNFEADIVLGLEPLEVLRALPMIKEDTRVVTNTGQIVPFSLAIQGVPYPSVEETLKKVRAVLQHLVEVDGPALTQKVGVPRTLNVVMLGALAGLKLLPFENETLWKAITKKCPPRYLDANRQAFELGIQSV
jgi:indolepyruvate ferredoxin oxidoreductase beta subunit